MKLNKILRLLLLVALLGAVLVFIFQARDRKRVQIQHDEIKSGIIRLEMSVMLFKLDVGRYPSTAEGLDALFTNKSHIKRWDGPYVKEEQLYDSWYRKFHYKFPSGHSGYEIYCLGADGQEGGSSEDEDIYNWQIKKKEENNSSREK